MEATLSEKDRKFRNFSLNGAMHKVILHVCFPLALTESLNQLFKILDTMMAAHISASAVSSVAYLSQISLMLSALGGGLAVGASIKVSEAFGRGDYELVRKRVRTLFAICAIVGGVMLLILVPGAELFLRLMNTPEEFLQKGTSYFIVELFGLVITFFNNAYIAVERSRGNSNRILQLNMAVIGVKLGLTALFVYVLNGSIIMISMATLISQACLLLAGITNMNRKGNAFGFSLKAISWKSEVVRPMLSLSFPVIVEKAAFAMGKVVVNSMSTVYGALTVGALGISNNIDGITSNPNNGVQAGGAAVISQNVGANRMDRVLSAFKWMLIYCVIISSVTLLLTIVFLNQLIGLFSSGDAAFAEMIKEIYLWEAIGAIPLGVNAAVLGLLYGLGKSKVTLFMNFCRIFVFRIPVLWALQQFTSLGGISSGIVMASAIPQAVCLHQSLPSLKYVEYAMIPVCNSLSSRKNSHTKLCYCCWSDLYNDCNRGVDMLKMIQLNLNTVQAVNTEVSDAMIDGEQVLRVVKSKSVTGYDENTYAKVPNLSFHNGTITVKMLSRLLDDAPDYARGFIGIAFRINHENNEFESFYIRPTNAHTDDPTRKSHGAQYFSYPTYTFAWLREHGIAKYDAEIEQDLDEWVTLKAVIHDSEAVFYLNDSDTPTMMVTDLIHGPESSGSIGLFVDIGTEGFFKDLTVESEEK